MAAQVGVVILDLDQPGITARCLRSLAEGSRVPDLVVVVANGSESFTCQHDPTLAALKAVTLHSGRNHGCASGRNLGLHYLVDNTSLQRFLVLDNDTIAPRDFVERVTNFSLSALEVVAPVILDWQTNDVWSSGGTVGPDGAIRQLTQVASPDLEARTVVDWAPGACLIVDRETWKTVGPFDDQLDFLFEDIEWCVRLRNAGGRVVVRGDLRLLHEPHQSLGGRWSQARVRLWARNGTLFRIRTVRSHPLAVARWLGSEALLAVRDLATGRGSWSSARLRGLTEGLTGGILDRVQEGGQRGGAHYMRLLGK